MIDKPCLPADLRDPFSSQHENVEKPVKKNWTLQRRREEDIHARNSSHTGRGSTVVILHSQDDDDDWRSSIQNDLVSSLFFVRLLVLLIHDKHWSNI